MKLSSTASSTCPATMLANSRTVSAKIRATRPMISSGTSSGDSQSGPGLKWARYCLPPSRRPLTITIPSVIRARVAVIQTLPVAVPPMLAPKIRDRRDRQQAEQVHREDEEEDRPDELDEAVGVAGPGPAARSPCGGTGRSPRWRCRRRSAPGRRSPPCRAAAAPTPGSATSSSAAAISIMTMWLSSRVILPPGVRNPRLAGRWIIGCRTMCSSGFSDSMRKASIEKFSVPF